MKTVTIEISHAALIFDAARSSIVARPDRTNGFMYDIKLERGHAVHCVPAREIDLRDVGGPHTYQIPNLDAGNAQRLIELLDDLDIAYSQFVDTKIETIKVKITDLLDTHWVLCQMIDTPKLRITSTTGVDYYLDYVNDNDDALWASFDCSGHNAADGIALVDALTEQATKYEVL